MKYYAAVVNEDEIKASVLMPPYSILASYHYFKKKRELIKDCVTKGYDVFIDSGAFSAANSGKEIDINDYCHFIRDTQVVTYAGLDVIGDAKKTRENTEYMIEEFGLNPIPTFHLGSDPSDLKKLFDYEYIALGGLVFAAGAERYCDEIWSIILRDRPNMRVHGFGMTNVDLMSRYPWYSVDSSSFKGCKRFGRQQILWNGFEFKTFSEEEYIQLLFKMGYTFLTDEQLDAIELSDGKEHRKLVETNNNRKKWLLYDFYSVQSYKLYGAHLKAVNKIKDFSYLTAQQKLL